jgi:DNA-binding transcriptional LysR family regulator
MIVVGDEGGDLGFEITRQVIVLEQDTVLERLMPALDLALGHRMIRRAADMLHVLAVEPFGQVRRDVAGAVVGEKPWPETNVASACLGLGLIQAPRYRVTSELANGALVEVLADFPPSPLPVHVLYSHTRQLSPRLRVFIDWMAEQFRQRLSPAG